MNHSHGYEMRLQEAARLEREENARRRATAEARLEAERTEARKRRILNQSAPDLLSLLKEAIEAMEQEISNRDGSDTFDITCGNCEAGVPLAHSFGCRARNAIAKAEGKS